MPKITLTPLEKGKNEELFEFPCELPIKVMGKTGEDFERLVVDIIRRHSPDFKEEDITQRSSSGGKYTSITITFTAQSRTQLDAVYQELSQHERVKMVL